MDRRTRNEAKCEQRHVQILVEDKTCVYLRIGAIKHSGDQREIESSIVASRKTTYLFARPCERGLLAV